MSITRKTNRKGVRDNKSLNRTKSVEQKFTLYEMFERFMNYKVTEGLTDPTIKGYYEHFRYFSEFVQGNLSNEEVISEIFRDYIGFMLNEKKLAPTTANVRIRTMRAFLRHCFQEGWIEIPIHERFKPVKTPEDEIESFTPAEIKSLINQKSSPIKDRKPYRHR